MTSLPDPRSSLETGNTPGWKTWLFFLLPPSLLASITWLAADVNYLLSHTLAELFSIVVAVTALVVATTSRRFTRNHFVVYVSVAIGWCAGLDLLHSLVFKGMHLLPTESANPATQFWIAARFMQATALVTAPLFLRRTTRVEWLHLGFGAWSVLSTILITTGQFPDAYIDGQGLTLFKIITEYIIIGLLGLTLLLFWRQRSLMSGQLLVSMGAAALAMIVSEFAFTQYVSVYAQSNLVGHLLKIYAYWFVYMALVQSTLREPFSMLARAASTYDAVPDPTLIVSVDGTIRQANHAAAAHCGYPAEQLVGQSSHALFHDADLPIDRCPVCSRLTERDQAFLQELDLPAQRAVECSAAPFAQEDRKPTWVQVIRDITERRQMARERETLLSNLGERVKELRSMYAVAELTKQANLDLPRLFGGVVQLLPAGFLIPEQLQVSIEGDWGHFGTDWPAAEPRQQLSERVTLADGTGGTIRVWYPDSSATDSPLFLPEERALMQSVARHVGETVERLHAAERLQRLSHLYELLSATNRAVVHSQDQTALLQSIFQALQAHGTFAMFFIALTDDGHIPMHLAMQHGVPPEHLSQLDLILSDPAGPLGRLFDELRRGEVVWSSMTHNHTAPSGNPDDKLGQWQRYLMACNVNQLAVLPLVCDGQLKGVVWLYASGLTVFDSEQLRLLNEMTGDMNFALETMADQQRRLAAEQQILLMEHRFEQVFRYSPVPMQIESLDNHHIYAINEAHQHWLGYELDDIADEDRWFQLAYPDQQVREDLQRKWTQSLAQAKVGQVAHSPELTVSGKDGRLHQAFGTMTVVGSDVIIAWTDLTDIRQSEQALRESEHRFRGMVEQTVSGMYVRRHGKFIYVNPRYCEIIGWSETELLGQDVLKFTSQDPENLARIQRAWEELHSGQHRVTYCVPVQRKNGQLIELDLTANIITWDDGLPATIVMAQDITERKRAEQKIATYVKQLEGAMRGTLQAVSNMVEIRDPYTAGHERRVGLIASAIARELNWSAERCNNLELLGLVHDIGKIAVPSEILTKPTHLTPLEMALMKNHAQVGYDILKNVPFPMPVAEIIWQHHERMDGSGYPQGLKGDAILPEARVLAVADVLESMSSHRPYRPALGLDAALDELVSHQGRLYDPEMVDAVIRLFKQRGYVLPT
ncbi:MASE3 domain-containing protein [Rhodoferax sp.]|uniref:MASE3 domain-containing protein n=1 Tax=Rhodoferax sp. TaxID=50421 RepID=UPI00260C2ABC|nr:MASE3 domain-containing protein [Rhodoferax sp.]MDD2925114.1 MASE3 domain-containing protein [Rhodoferax sp.]